MLFFQGSVWWALPNVIYGLMGISAGLFTLLLPETLGVKMCETIDEAEGRDDAETKQNRQHESEVETLMNSNNGIEDQKKGDCKDVRV